VAFSPRRRVPSPKYLVKNPPLEVIVVPNRLQLRLLIYRHVRVPPMLPNSCKHCTSGAFWAAIFDSIVGGSRWRQTNSGLSPRLPKPRIRLDLTRP
jgi:hypothetical protein